MYSIKRCFYLEHIAIPAFLYRICEINVPLHLGLHKGVYILQMYEFCNTNYVMAVHNIQKKVTPEFELVGTVQKDG